MTEEVLDLLPPHLFLAVGQQGHFIRETLLLAEDDVPLLVHLSVLHFAGQGGLKRALSEGLLSLSHHASMSCNAQAGHSSRHDSRRASSCHESMVSLILVAPVIIRSYRSI